MDDQGDYIVQQTNMVNLCIYMDYTIYFLTNNTNTVLSSLGIMD